MITGFIVGKYYRCKDVSPKTGVFDEEKHLCTKVSQEKSSVASFDCDLSPELMEDYASTLKYFELVESERMSIVIPSFRVTCSEDAEKETFGSSSEELARKTQGFLYKIASLATNSEDFNNTRLEEELLISISNQEFLPQDLVALSSMFIRFTAVMATSENIAQFKNML